MTTMSDASTKIDHTTKAFDTDLQDIARKVAEMGGLAERQIGDAIQALVDRDTELAERVIGTDPAIDTLQHEIEELIDELTDDYTIVIVTHNMQQAARVSDFTAFMYLGELIEFDSTSKMFTAPQDQRTQDYITGRFG